MWQKLVEAELTPENMLNQALNCLLVETPAGGGPGGSRQASHDAGEEEAPPNAHATVAT